MNIKILYGDRPFVAPTLTREIIASLDGQSARVLLALLSDNSFTENDLCTTLGISKKELSNAWITLEKSGLVLTDGKEIIVKEKPDKPKKRSEVMETLVYTDKEFETVLDGRSDLQSLITEAQNALGKPLYQADSKLLVSIAEAYDYDEDFMLTLLAYCNRIGKRNMRYVEKVATSLYDLGIKTSVELLAHLNTQEQAYYFEKTVRRIFGLGSRAFTSKEKVFLKAWQDTYQIEEELLQKAYDITVAATAKPSLNYANSILERWFAEGIKTLADLEKAEKEKTAAGKTGTTAISYNADDFFSAALDRSYNDEPKKEN